MKKRLAAVLLTVLLLITALPVHASAAAFHTALRVPYTFVPHASSHDIDAVSVYADAFFRVDPTVYNPTLAHLSLALALTCGASRQAYDENGSWDPVGSTVHAEAFLCGTKDRSRLGITSLGFSDFARSADITSGEPQTDSVGAVAAHKTIRENGEDYTLIALGIRGLRYGDEWADNFRVGLDGDHAGFSAASKRVIAFLGDYIRTYLPDASKLKLWITGYSRSAIIANMTAAAVYDGALNLPAGVTVNAADDLYCYTFATPRGVHTENIKPWSNIFNVISGYDIVPSVAPKAWGFGRHGIDVILPTHENSDTFAEDKTVMQTYLDAILGEETVSVLTDDSVSVMKDISIRLDRLFSDPDNIIDIEYSEETPSAALEGGLDWFFTNVFSSREDYAILENELLTALGPDAPVGISFETLLSSIAKTAEDSFSDKGELLLLLAPMMLPHIDNSDAEDYRAEADARFDEMFDTFLFDLEQNLGTSLSGTVWETLLHTILYKILDRAAYEIANDNYHPIGQLIGGMAHVIDSGLAAHFPEVSLAWLRTLDPAVSPSDAKDHSQLMSAYLTLLAGQQTEDTSADNIAEERISAYRGMAISGMLHDIPLTEKRAVTEMP